MTVQILTSTKVQILTPNARLEGRELAGAGSEEALQLYVSDELLIV